MISDTIVRLSLKKDIHYDEMRAVMEQILGGNIPVRETAEFLKNLALKGESDEELLAMLNVMDEHSIKINPRHKGRLIDVCGTGGDSRSTFNVSTTSAFIIAASGVGVAKHGNRSASGVTGSADIFEYFGYDLSMSPERVKELIERFNIGFMFAQKFHPAMKNVAEARRALGTRTAFNLLGPLSNPAGVKNQMVGVFAPSYLQRVITLLQARGAENVMAVISEDGLDELTTTSSNQITELKEGKIQKFTLDPYTFGLERSSLSEIQVSTRAEAVRSFVSVLHGTGSRAMIDVTTLNAAAGLIVGGVTDRWEEAIGIASETIRSGKSFDLLRKFVRFCGDAGKLEEVACL
ncbi:MAG: anthranilate phosphoribosyltransferase [Thaumarchaeota archaeon]|nr:anthranilate phosphoribosyltransferase [Nitrososphaerota archaeon]